MPRIATNKKPRIIIAGILLATVAVAFLAAGQNEELILPTPDPGNTSDEPGSTVFNPPSEDAAQEETPFYNSTPSDQPVATTNTRFSFVDNLLENNYQVDEGAVGNYRPKRAF